MGNWLDSTARHKRTGFVQRLAFGTRQLLLGLFSVNLAACKLFVGRGRKPAMEFVSYTYKLYSGYGLPGPFHDMPWRSDCLLPRIPASEVFPEIDFTRSPELLFPFPRVLSVSPLELGVLALLVRHLQPKRVIEFGTAEGRTTLNLALYLPPDGEVLTIDLPQESASNGPGYLGSGHPVKARIRQLLGDVTQFDWTPYERSADLVFCDACDLYEGFAKETAAGLRVVRPGGVVLWHDYGFVRDRTAFLNELGCKLPVSHIEGTTIACLRVESPEFLKRV
jgi:methyltransferase family protein